MKYKFLQENNSFCRVYYRNIENKKLYCMQLNGKDSFELFECTKDAEPSFTVKFDKNELDLPYGDTKIGEELIRFLTIKETPNFILVKRIKGKKWQGIATLRGGTCLNNAEHIFNEKLGINIWNVEGYSVNWYESTFKQKNFIGFAENYTQLTA